MKRLLLLFALISVPVFGQVNNYNVPSTGVGLAIVLGPGSCVNTSGTVVTYAGAVIPLTAQTTNYGYLDSTCTVRTNTTGFASGGIPIFSAVTGLSQVNTITDQRSHFFFTATGAVTSVFTRTGAVTAQSGDYTCAQVTGCPPATTGYYVLGNGLVCDGVTDDTAAFNTLLTTVNTAGGGSIIFPQGHTCKFSSAEITIPNNADTWTDGSGTISSQAPVHWTCDAGNVQYQQLMSTGATLSQIQNACVIDLEFNATDAKLVFLGLGHLEIDHLAFVDKNTDCASFMLFTNTIPDLHDNAFIGSTLSQTGGPYSCNDIMIMGGAGATGPCKTVGCWFQGYAGARVANNFFNQVKRAVIMNNAAQTIMVLNNTVWSQSGCSTCGAFEVPGAGVYGNTYSYNNIETVHYLYGLNITSTASDTVVIGQTCSDTSEFSTICVHTTGSDVGTLVLGGVAPAGSMIAAGDVTTNALIFNTGGSLWKNTFHFNGFMNLIDQTSTPVGTAGTGAFFSQAQYLRPAFTKWHASTLFRVVGLEEIPTTQASLATDNFTRANAATLGANWTAINSLTSLQILSNAAVTQASSAYEGDAYTAVTFPNDQYSQCTIGTVVVNSNNFVGCAVRIQSGAQSLYLLRMDTAGSAFCGITKFTAGSQTTLQACSGAGWSSNNLPVSGDIITLTAVGNTITAYKNGIQLATTTDSSFPTGSPGVIAFASTASTAISYSAWAGGAMDCTTGAVTASSVIGGVICGGPLANASTVQKSESGADTNVLTFATSTVPATYRINFALSVSAATAGVVGWTATWTDSNGNAQTPTNLAFFQVGTPAPQLTFTTSAAGDYYGTALVDTNNSGTNIVIKFTLGSGSVTAKASASVERVQ